MKVGDTVWYLAGTSLYRITLVALSAKQACYESDNGLHIVYRSDLFTDETKALRAQVKVLKEVEKRDRQDREREIFRNSRQPVRRMFGSGYVFGE